MAKTAEYVQRGEAIDYKNSTEAVIPASTVVIFGKHIGVTGNDIAPGETGSLHMIGIFRIPKKASVALAAGDDIVFTDADGVDKATTTVMGYAVEAATAEDATALVRIG